MKTNNSIGILTLPIQEAGKTPLSNLLKIISEFSNPIYLISGLCECEAVYKKEVTHLVIKNFFKDTNQFYRIFNYLCYQVICSYFLVKNRRNINTWVLFLGGQNLIFPMIAGKFLRKKMLIMLPSSSFHTYTYKNDIFIKIEYIPTRLNYRLSDKIIIYSEIFIKKWDLENFKNKIVIASHHFIDFNKFNRSKKFSERQNIIGYIGRFTQEKGILNLLGAISLVQKTRNDIIFLLIGNGPQLNEIKKIFGDNNLDENVIIKGWVPREELPNYLNEMKLLVIPSYSEGLPNVMIEAMACGTPVIASSV